MVAPTKYPGKESLQKPDFLGKFRNGMCMKLSIFDSLFRRQTSIIAHIFVNFVTKFTNSHEEVRGIPKKKLQKLLKKIAKLSRQKGDYVRELLVLRKYLKLGSIISCDLQLLKSSLIMGSLTLNLQLDILKFHHGIGNIQPRLAQITPVFCLS